MPLRSLFVTTSVASVACSAYAVIAVQGPCAVALPALGRGCGRRRKGKGRGAFRAVTDRTCPSSRSTADGTYGCGDIVVGKHAKPGLHEAACAIGAGDFTRARATRAGNTHWGPPSDISIDLGCSRRWSRWPDHLREFLFTVFVSVTSSVNSIFHLDLRMQGDWLGERDARSLAQDALSCTAR